MLDGIRTTVDEKMIKNQIISACGKKITSFSNLDASGILYRAFVANNDVLFNVLLEMRADPFKRPVDSVVRMSAYDMIRATESRSSKQNAMLDILIQKYNTTRRFSGSEGDQSPSTALKYWARNTDWTNLRSFAERQGISSFNMKYVFDDGSNVLLQSIIGNNYTLFEEIMRTLGQESNTTEINKPWASTSTPPQDFIDHFGFNPINWAPLMLTTALSRELMFDKLWTAAGINKLVFSSSDLDSRVLARNLPLKYRMKMLKKLKTTISNLTTDACMAYPSYAEAIRLAPENDACLSYHSWKYGVANDVAARAAVMYLNPKKMEVVLREWDCEGKRDLFVWSHLWKALKADTLSSAEDLAAKIAAISGAFGMKLDVPGSYENGKTPWVDVLTDPGINEKLMQAVLSNDSLFDVQSAKSFNGEPSLIIAARHGNSSALKSMLTHRVRLGLNITVVSAAPFNENILHLAISHVKDDAKLFNLVDYILAIRPQFLNETSHQSSQNRAEYVVNGLGSSSQQRVSYSISMRSQWTPLMYAVALRKNKTAALLIDKGALIDHEGLDGVSATTISAERCRAFTTFHRAWLSPVRDATEINSAKLAANKAHIEKMIQEIINDLDSKIMY